MRVSISDQGVVERFAGRTWEKGHERAVGRWREAQALVDALAAEVELLALEVVVGARRADDDLDERQVHVLIVPDVPAGVRTAPRTGGAISRHTPARIDGAALKPLAAAGEWCRLTVLAAAVPTLDPKFALERASDVRPTERRGLRVVAGPLDRPGLGLHAPLDVTIADAWGTTTLTLERAWSSWLEKGPELDRYGRVVGRLTKLGLTPEPLG
jgi:hypothetical protein